MNVMKEQHNTDSFSLLCGVRRPNMLEIESTDVNVACLSSYYWYKILSISDALARSSFIFIYLDLLLRK